VPLTTDHVWQDEEHTNTGDEYNCTAIY